MSSQVGIDALITQDAIRTISGQYVLGRDRLNADLLRSLFCFDGARVGYGFYRGSPRRFVAFGMHAARSPRESPLHRPDVVRTGR